MFVLQDFILSIILGLAWFAGSIAWLVSVVNLDHATRYKRISGIISTLYPCTSNQSYCQLKKSSAYEVIYASPVSSATTHKSVSQCFPVKIFKIHRIWSRSAMLDECRDQETNVLCAASRMLNRDTVNLLSKSKPYYCYLGTRKYCEIRETSVK